MRENKLLPSYDLMFVRYTSLHYKCRAVLLKTGVSLQHFGIRLPERIEKGSLL